MNYRVEDAGGELITCAGDIEVAMSLMKRIDRAVRVTTDEKVTLAVKVPPLVIRVGRDEVGYAPGIPGSYFTCAPHASGWS